MERRARPPNRIAWLGLVASLAVIALASTAAPALASCLPPQMQTFDDPVIVSGTVTDVTDDAVGLVVDGWWGEGARGSVAVKRPKTDPTVVSSTDWTPGIGERWLVAGRLQGDQLVSDICKQWLATPDIVAEVVRSLGEAATAPPDTGNEAGGSPEAVGNELGQDAATQPAPSLPLLGAAAVVASATLVVYLVTRRRPG